VGYIRKETIDRPTSDRSGLPEGLDPYVRYLIGSL